MLNGNISLEEDTELRDLVVQTLENNGVLAKVRAELRASVFLTLEEQQNVLNPEPFLNKSVKQYLSSSEGKLLFSLVREFLEYFGLDYTISVYDPETYFGKEYNYSGRKKLCEELGINSREPLLGEILKNTISSALHNSQKNNANETAENIANATFDISIPKILQKDLSALTIDPSQKLESLPTSNLPSSNNITVQDKQSESFIGSEFVHHPVTEISKFSSDKNCNKNVPVLKENCALEESVTLSTAQLDFHQNQDACMKTNSIELQTVNNVKSKKQSEQIKNVGSTVYFDERIVDGMKEKITGSHNSELLDETPLLPSINNSVFTDLPPINGRKTNMNDLKELIDLAQGLSQFDEDSTSVGNNEDSFENLQSKPKNSIKVQRNKQDFVQSVQSDNDSEEIDKKISN